MTKVSYVVPTLNSAKTLDETLFHLRSQRNVTVDIIVVDSGSSDGTLEICKRWGVKSLYVPPGNMYKAINFGLKECEGNWVGYINSDDYLYADGVSRLLEFGQKVDADIVYGNADFIDHFGRFLYSYTSPKTKYLLSIAHTGAPPFPQQSVIFKKDLFYQLGGFNEKYRLAADKDFFFRAMKLGSKFAFLPGIPVACFRLHEKQLSTAQASKLKKEGLDITRNHFSNPSILDWLIYANWKINNLPNYVLRFFRQSILAGKLKYTSSIFKYLQTNIDNVNIK